ncbi:MAG TPA: prevent-host-death protein [Chloroflexi bacterium]|nr:prevent-host-death protein [Chloroflexota bacterium]HHW86849.1 type II toxin-antitoxin system Phd/YefM family antitoxin [Chloroflexota bacterium]
MTSWQVQEAKNKLSEVIERASQGEVQIITRCGEEIAVVIGIEAYRRLTTPAPPLIDVLRNAPPGFEELEITRQQGLAPEALEL